MKIFAMVTDAFGGFGGIANYNCCLLNALAACESVDQIEVLPRLAAGSLEGIPPKVLQHAPVGSPLAYSFAALRHSRQLGKDTVVFCGHPLMVPLAAVICRLKGLPLWLQVHGIDAWEMPSKQVRWGAERADLITSVSRFTRSQMISTWWGGDPAKIRVLPNTVNPMYCTGPKSDTLIERYGLAGKKVLLTVSRISRHDRYKGHDRVLEALPRILERYPEVNYLIAGDGDDVGRLKTLANTFGVEAYVKFVGRLPDSEMLELYRTADVFIMPSTKEGFGIVFLEAAACGLQVIGGNADGSVDALHEGDVGVAIDPNSIDDIVASVLALIDAPKPVRPTGTATYSFDRFSIHVEHLAVSCSTSFR